MRQLAEGMFMIEIPLSHLHLIRHVEFMSIRTDVPTLLLVRDMIERRLDISIQMCYISFKDKVQKLDIEKVVLIYKWNPEDIPVRTLHRVQCHYNPPHICSSVDQTQRRAPLPRQRRSPRRPYASVY